jgi:DNA-binding transcriptional LysR family regulator
LQSSSANWGSACSSGNLQALSPLRPALHTRSIFRDIERARSAIEDLKGLRAGQVAIYAMEGIVGDFLPSLFSSFRTRFPGISFNLVLAPTDRIIEAVVHDEADIGITFNAGPRQDVSVVARYAEPVSCLVSPRHPLAREKVVTLQRLNEFPLALPDQAFGLRQPIDLAAKRRGITLNAMTTTNSLDLTKRLAASGAAIAFMPAFTVSDEIASGSLRRIPVNERAFQSAHSDVCVHKSRTISAAAKEFLAALVAAMKALQPAKTAF